MGLSSDGIFSKPVFSKTKVRVPTKEIKHKYGACSPWLAIFPAMAATCLPTWLALQPRIQARVQQREHPDLKSHPEERHWLLGLA